MHTKRKIDSIRRAPHFSNSELEWPIKLTKSEKLAKPFLNKIEPSNLEKGNKKRHFKGF